MKEDKELMEKIVSLAKRRGFVFPGSDIYGGLAGTWDYGDLGGELLHNIKHTWWKRFVSRRRDMYGIRAAILMNGKVWEASGHVAGFSDPLVECTKCHSRFRADSLIDNQNNFEELKKDYTLFLKKELEQYEKDVNNLGGSLKESISGAIALRKDMTEEQKESFNKALEPIYKKFEAEISLLNKKGDEMTFFAEQLNQSSRYLGFLTHLYLNTNVLCPERSCRAHKSWSVPTQFNMMFSTKVGAMDDSAAVSYLRPETAQGIFVNFKNTVDAYHPKLPFGIAQIGKAFRNEITPRDFLFRQREFEQMEIEYFIRPEDWEKYFLYWRDEMLAWMEEIGLDMNKVHELEVADEDRAFYSKRTIDFEFDWPFGRKELFGLAYRTDYDLGVHKLDYIDEERGERIVPHVIEPSCGVDRAFLALMLSAYNEEEKDGETRVFLKFKPNMAPILACVSPLLKNKPELVEYANTKVYAPLKEEFGRIAWDDNGNIGKRYRRQDEIGTPYCIVIDFDTLEDDSVTIRDRDTGTQERVKVSELVNFLKGKLN